MFLHILNEPRILLLNKLLDTPPVPGTYLVGGTALALMCGHRESIDFNWFTAVPFKGEDIKNALLTVGELRVSEIKKGIFHGFVDGIQVTWLHYPNPMLKKFVRHPNFPNLKLASILDIAVMKWVAISDRGSRKDFIDLYFICQSQKGLTMESLLPLLEKKFPGRAINYYHTIKSLSYFEDAEQEAWPVMHMPVEWEEIKEFFRLEQAKLLRNHIDS